MIIEAAANNMKTILSIFLNLFISISFLDAFEQSENNSQSFVNIFICI